MKERGGPEVRSGGSSNIEKNMYQDNKIFRSLCEIVHTLGHSDRIIDVLKIDIDGAEYESLLPLLPPGHLHSRSLLFPWLTNKSQQPTGDRSKSGDFFKSFDSSTLWTPPLLPNWSSLKPPTGCSPESPFPLARQLLIEIHINPPKNLTADHAQYLLRALAAQGYTIFHKEPNIRAGGGQCTEYALLLLHVF